MIATATTTHLPYHKKETSTQNTPTWNLSNQTILHLLNTNCKASHQHLKQAHAVVLKSGHFLDHFIAGSLLKCYANHRLNDLDYVLKVFASVHKPNVFVWNILLQGCLDHNDPSKVIHFYYNLVIANSRPNKFTYPVLFKACGVTGAVKQGSQIHAHVVKQGLSKDGHIKSAGIQMYASFGDLVVARGMLDCGESKSDVVCWNAMIDGYLKVGDAEEAKVLFEKMPKRTVGSWNCMISGFCRCEMIEEARKLFDEMIERDEISWSAMLDGYVKGGYFKEALELFNQMQRKDSIPTKFIIPSVLAACANLGALDEGRWIHAYMKKNSIVVDDLLGTALIDMYAKCGSIDMAWDVFAKLLTRKQVFCWNAMIGGRAMHGQAEEAINLFYKMQNEKVKPNKITFVNILNACAHAGMVDQGLKIYSSMKNVHEVEPDIEHYGCMVDLFARAGFLAKAMEFIESMPIKPNAAVWGALLGACKIYGNVELGEKIGKMLLEMDSLNSGRYTLLSNLYAKAERWEDVAEVRKLMKARGLKTTPGISTINLNGRFHEFKIGDTSHSQKNEIYEMLENMIKKLKMNGYSPNTSSILFDIEEEEKESELRYHSEKLAIAFGLISTKEGATIRISKNLRVCEDCHSVSKLISKVYGRDIIVRDRKRFHLFKDGVCSCKDFW